MLVRNLNIGHLFAYSADDATGSLPHEPMAVERENAGSKDAW
jgi:hypothetical protein